MENIFSAVFSIFRLFTILACGSSGGGSGDKIRYRLNLAIVFILFSALVFAIPATAYDEPASSSTIPTSSLMTFTVTVRKEGAPPAGMGRVFSAPTGISCPGTCSAAFDGGTQVMLYTKNTPRVSIDDVGLNLADFSDGMDFNSWGGDCKGTPRSSPCALTMDSDKDVPVRFYPPLRRTEISIAYDLGNSDFQVAAMILGDIVFVNVNQDSPKRDDDASERVSGMGATVVLTNNSTRSVDIGMIGGADPMEAPFEIFDDFCSNMTLPTYQECSFSINYDPVDNVLYEDTFDIPSSDPNFPEWTVTVREGEEDEIGN